MKEKLSDGTFLLFKKTLATVPSATKFFCIVLKRHDGTYTLYTIFDTRKANCTHAPARWYEDECCPQSEMPERTLRHHRYRGDYEDIVNISEGPTQSTPNLDSYDVRKQN